MENQGEGVSPDAQPQHPQPGIPAFTYPPPQFPPQAYPPMYQQPYPPTGQQPGYFALPSQGLPASPFPLQSMQPRNSLANISLALAALAGVVHFVAYGVFYYSYVHAQTRSEASGIYLGLAAVGIVVALIAIGAGVCAIVALTQAKIQSWHGLIPSLVGLVLSSLFLFVTLDEIISSLIASNALGSLL